MTTLLTRIQRFINRERDRFATKHNNMFAFAFSEIARYQRFLTVIRRRHRSVSKRFIDNWKRFQAAVPSGNHPMGPTLTKLHQRGIDLTLRLQLETEGFYLFAKILLDKVARSLEFYFGPVSRRPLDSHDDLVKNLAAYAAARGLTISDDLLTAAARLKTDIADFRDYQIAHEKSPRTVRGTLTDPGGTVRMLITQIYPTNRDKQKESKALDQLQSDLDEYLALVLELLKQNSARTRLDPDTSNT